jgi:hypothetical protein
MQTLFHRFLTLQTVSGPGYNLQSPDVDIVTTSFTDSERAIPDSLQCVVDEQQLGSSLTGLLKQRLSGQTDNASVCTVNFRINIQRAGIVSEAGKKLDSILATNFKVSSQSINIDGFHCDTRPFGIKCYWLAIRKS